MAFKRKTDTSTGEQAKFEKPGASLEGIYLGSFDHEGDYGPTKKHLFKTETGVKVVFGQRHLTDLLADEKPGILVRVTYTGDKKMKKGNPMKMYALDIDDEIQADAADVTEAVEAANDAGSYDEDDYAEDDTPSDEQPTAPVKAKPVATAPSSATQAKVKALLNRNKATA